MTLVTIQDRARRTNRCSVSATRHPKWTPYRAAITPGAELLRLTTAVRRLAFDTSLPPSEAMGRIRDAFQEYDRQGGIMR